MARAEKPWPIRAVIVTTFEVGNDTGDAPGEFQFWVEREHLNQVIDPFPGRGVHPLRTNKDHTILGMVSGTTLVNATASMMALGLDPRFDLTHAYILINGIAGIDPHIGSIGSAAWARFVIGDVAREIDPREAPKAWPYGIFPTSAKQPNPPPSKTPRGTAPTSSRSIKASFSGPTTRPARSSCLTTPPSLPSAPSTPARPPHSARPSCSWATPSPRTTTGTAPS